SRKSCASRETPDAALSLSGRGGIWRTRHRRDGCHNPESGCRTAPQPRLRPDPRGYRFLGGIVPSARRAQPKPYPKEPARPRLSDPTAWHDAASGPVDRPRARNLAKHRARKGGTRLLARRARSRARRQHFSDALAAQNGFFPGFYIGMVRAGEAGGSLDTTLRQLAELLERSRAAREHVKSALAYPLVVVATGCASIAVLFSFVIPRFEPLFDGAGATLPTTTRWILATSNIFRDDGWALLILTIALGFAVRAALRTPTGRQRWHRVLLRLPGIGDLITKIELARFSRTLGTLLRNGVSPLAALAITQDTIGNSVLRAALATVMESAKEGKGIAEPLEKTGLVPALAVQLTRVGEETARLDEMLLKIGEIYDGETQRSIERLLALLVPGITIALGIVVAIVMGSIVTAILSVYDLAM